MNIRRGASLQSTVYIVQNKCKFTPTLTAAELPLILAYHLNLLCYILHQSYVLFDCIDHFSSMNRVKSGKFGHQVNSDTHMQTV